MTVLQCRIFYLLALIGIVLLLLPSPGTVFLAICFSCLTLPLYRHFKYLSLKKLRRIPKKNTFRRSLCRKAPLFYYTVSIFASIVIPIATLALLVAPQASRGLIQLKNMELAEKLKVMMPENLKIFVNTHLPSLNDYPELGKILNELTENISGSFFSLLSEIFSPGAVWRRSVSLLGGSMTLLWVLFLFFILTILFTLYARQARTILTRILNLPSDMIRRFILTIYRALKAIMLGIVLVAMIQGLLCGLAFAVAGIESSAFWGLMAAFVAPIPMIGTMLVWGPLALVLWFKGSHFASVGLMIWGAVVVSGVDNICRPLFLQHGIRAPFFVLILVIICGMGAFGPIGVIAAPVLLAFSLQLTEEAHRQYQAAKMAEEKQKSTSLND